MLDQKISRKGCPFFSIVIPSYHSGQTLPDTLSSVFRQTFQNWQLIVCDDGTADFDKEALERKIQEQLPTRCTAAVLCQPQNIGTVRNLNTALRKATGKWVLLLAADDLLAETETLERLAATAADTANPWIVSRTELCDADLRHTGKFSPANIEMLRGNTAAELYEKLCMSCIFPSSGNLYRRALLEELGGFDEGYRLVEDWPLFLKLTRAGITPELCDAVAVLHRGGGVSCSSAARNRTYQRDLIETMRREILPHLESLPEKERIAIRRRCEDKMAIYEYRFERSGFCSRLKWLLMHGDVVIRKLMERV